MRQARHNRPRPRRRPRPREMLHPAYLEYHRCELWGYFGTAYLIRANVEDDDEDDDDYHGAWRMPPSS